MHLPRWAYSHASLRRTQAPLGSSRTGAPSWYISWEGPLSRLPPWATITPPTAVFYRRPPVCASSGKGPCHDSFRRHAHTAYSHLLPTHLVGASPGTGPCHASSHGHADVASGHLLPVHLVGASPGRGPCHASLHRIFSRCLRSSPTGERSWCIPRMGTCHASSNQHADVVSGYQLPANLVGASPGRSPCFSSLHRL